MKISVVLGTRPEIVKMSPIIRYFENTQEIFLLSIPMSALNLDRISIIPPQGFLEFLQLKANAKLIIRILGLYRKWHSYRSTLFDPTEYIERPETIEVGANTLSGVEPDSIMRSTEKMLNAPATWNNPFGDGMAAMKIVQILQGIK